MEHYLTVRILHGGVAVLLMLGLLVHAVLLSGGGILAVPTDSSYALVCRLDDKDAVDRIRRLRQINDKHHLTLLCRDLSELASYAHVDNRQYRLLKLATPGP